MSIKALLLYCFLNAFGRKGHLADTIYLQMKKMHSKQIALLFVNNMRYNFMANINGKNPLNKNESDVFLLLLQP